MTYEEVKRKLQCYLDLLRLVQVKRDMWEAAKQDACNIKAIGASLGVKSSSPPEHLNAVEKSADRLFRVELDYMEHCERLWKIEDEIKDMISGLREDEQTLIIERYMKGESLRYIAKKYYYQHESMYTIFGRIHKKLAERQSV